MIHPCARNVTQQSLQMLHTAIITDAAHSDHYRCCTQRSLQMLHTAIIADAAHSNHCRCCTQQSLQMLHTAIIADAAHSNHCRCCSSFASTISMMMWHAIGVVCTWEANPGVCRPRAARALSSCMALPAPQNLTAYPCSSASSLPHPSNSARVLHAQTRLLSVAVLSTLMALQPFASTHFPHSPRMRT